jgi:hypothetical protein
MILIVKQESRLLDSSRPGLPRVSVPCGEYEVERVPNPNPQMGTDWLCIKDDVIGAAEVYLRGTPTQFEVLG